MRIVTADTLQDLGLRPYDAKVLVALVDIGQAGTNELAEASGVPRTSIYKVMEDLDARGIVQVLPRCRPAVWTTRGWKAILDTLESEAIEQLTSYQKIIYQARHRKALVS